MQSLIDYTASYTDLYQLTMAQVYWKQGRADQSAVFDYSFRKLPYNGGYTVFTGLEELLDILEQLHFDQDDQHFLREHGFDPQFVDFLAGFRFQGSLYAMAEGDLAFPFLPIIQVEGTLLECQLIETLLLNVLNFQTLVATKASRMRRVAGDRVLIDFGMRRAQGAASYAATRAAIVGGFDATSNVRAGRDYDLRVSGTMAHSFIQSYDNELEAFRDYAAVQADTCVLLVDTYDTLHSGVPNAIKVGLELKQRGHQLQGIRLDSGDLAYLAKQTRRMLDEAGLPEVKIAASNQLDEYVIKSLLDQQAPIDIFGVGTNLVTGQPDAALDGVYKLTSAQGKPRIKVSENLIKTTLPDRKQVYRFLDMEGKLQGADAIVLRSEQDVREMVHPHEAHRSMLLSSNDQKAMLQLVMQAGKRTSPARTLSDIARSVRDNLMKLPPEYQRFDNPHIYKVGISRELEQLRNQLIKSHEQ